MWYITLKHASNSHRWINHMIQYAFEGYHLIFTRYSTPTKCFNKCLSLGFKILASLKLSTCTWIAEWSHVMSFNSYFPLAIDQDVALHKLTWTLMISRGSSIHAQNLVLLISISSHSWMKGCCSSSSSCDLAWPELLSLGILNPWTCSTWNSVQEMFSIPWSFYASPHFLRISDQTAQHLLDDLDHSKHWCSALLEPGRTGSCGTNQPRHADSCRFGQS